MHQRPTEIGTTSTKLFSDEAMVRKTRSILRLKIEKVPFAEDLPVIGESSTAIRRTKEEICHRAAALYIVALKGKNAKQNAVNALVTKYGIESAFSPSELSFIRNPEPTKKDNIQFTWRYESYWVMLWTLGYIEMLSRPDVTCNIKIAVSALEDRNMKNFIKDARLRRLNKILDLADLTYRYHWAVADALRKGNDAPAGLNCDVVIQRHHAFSWLIGRISQGWDDKWDTQGNRM